MNILRSLLVVVAVVALPAIAEKPHARGRKPVKASNKYFYNADGTFAAAKAKQAYYEMMKRFGCPVYDKLKTDDFWAIDFGLGDFVNVGMAGIFLVERQEGRIFWPRDLFIARTNDCRAWARGDTGSETENGSVAGPTRQRVSVWRRRRDETVSR
jgi:hypothetical protein